MQVRQYTKGSPEITIFHSFARSNYFVQLKYRFSPPSPRLSRVRLLQCRSLPLALPLPPPPFRPFHPGHPPYGNIDHAQPRDSSPSRPRPFCYTATRFLSIALSFRLSLSLRRFLSFTFFRSLVSFSLSVSLFLLFLSLCLHLRYSGFNIQLLATASARGPLAKSGKRSRLRFLRAHKRARVSLPSCGCRLTVRSRGGK